jgi:hypothetical protein
MKCYDCTEISLHLLRVILVDISKLLPTYYVFGCVRLYYHNVLFLWMHQNALPTI